MTKKQKWDLLRVLPVMDDTTWEQVVAKLDSLLVEEHDEWLTPIAWE